MPKCDMTHGNSEARKCGLNSLYINPTRFCNLRCRHCWLAPQHREELSASEGEMTTDEITAVIKEARDIGLTEVKFTGGEPLLRPDIGDMIEFCRRENVGVSIETNGTLITPEMARHFADNGVGFVSVSLDSHIEEMNDRLRGVKGAYVKALNGIRSLLESGLRPQIILSLYKENLPGLDRFVEFMSDLGVNSIKLNTISPMGRGAALYEKGEIPSLEETISFSRDIGSLRDSFPGMIYLDVPSAFKSIEDFHSGCMGVCQIKSILGIMSDGSVSICGIGHVEEELVFGNVRKDPGVIKRVWGEAEMLRKIKEEIPCALKGVCGICVLRNLCKGYCRAEVFHNTRDLLAPYWFCQEAYDKGLFPETRLVPEALRSGYGKV